MERLRFLKYAGATAATVGTSMGLESLLSALQEPIPPTTVTTTKVVTKTITVSPTKAGLVRAGDESSGLLLAGIGAILVGQILSPTVLLMVSSSMTVLGAIYASAKLTAALISRSSKTVSGTNEMEAEAPK